MVYGLLLAGIYLQDGPTMHHAHAGLLLRPVIMGVILLLLLLRVERQLILVVDLANLRRWRLQHVLTRDLLLLLLLLLSEITAPLTLPGQSRRRLLLLQMILLGGHRRRGGGRTDIALQSHLTTPASTTLIIHE